jgi:hypothetical protein
MKLKKKIKDNKKKGPKPKWIKKLKLKDEIEKKTKKIRK